MKSITFSRVFSSQPNQKRCHGEGFAPSFLPSFLPCFLILLIILLAFGCKKETKIVQDQLDALSFFKDSEEVVQVTEGVLCFMDMGNFDYFYQNLLNMPDSLRKIQEARWGFVSYSFITDSLSDIIFESTNENDMLQLIVNNSSFMKIEDSTLTTQLPFHGYHYVANADGIFKIDSTFFRIFPEGIVGWRGATLSQIKSLTLNEDFDDDLSDGKFFYTRNVELDPIESNCGNYKRVEKYTNGNTYRVIFEIKVEKHHLASSKCPATGQYIEFVYYKTTLRIVGQRKRFFIWNSYITNLEYKDVYCELNVPRQDGYNHQICKTIPRYELGGLVNKSGYKGSSRGWIFEFEGAANGMGDMMHNIPTGDIDNPVFIKVKGKAKSSALGINNWAEISCGY